MIAAYTEDTLKSLTKFQIIHLFLKIQDHTNNAISKFSDKIKKLNANFKRLQSDVKVGKKNVQYPSETGSFP